MENIIFNAAAARLVRKDGRDWRVAPMAIIVPGVLAGSKGPLLYEPEECRNSVPEWDGTPITMFHPTDAYGRPVSAGHPNAKRIGYLRNTSFDGKLRTEGWFDVEETRNVDAELGTNVLWSLENGRPVELSTGLYTDNQPSKGVHKGRPYDFIARNYRADHLAVLPGQTGACSIGDGCGVLVNAAKGQLRWKEGEQGSSHQAKGVGRAKYEITPTKEGHHATYDMPAAKGSGGWAQTGSKGEFKSLGVHPTVEAAQAAAQSHHDQKRDEQGKFAANKKEEGCGDGG